MSVNPWEPFDETRPTNHIFVASHSRMIDTLRVFLELLGPEVDRAQVAGRVAFGLVVEVR